MQSFALTRDIEERWKSLIALGVLLVLCGLAALLFVGLSSLISVLYLGMLFMLGGIAEIAFGIQKRKEGQLGYHLVVGLLFAVGGWFIFSNPLTNLFVFTLMIAILFLVSGLANLIGSITERFSGWGWFALNGLIAVAAGVMILRNPVESSYWLIGTLTGIEFLFRGFAWISLGMAGRRLSIGHGLSAAQASPLV